MAMASEISVEVTNAIHNAFKDVANAVFQKNGIVVREVRIEWLNVSAHGKTDYRVQEVETTSATPYT